MPTPTEIQSEASVDLLSLNLRKRIAVLNGLSFIPFSVQLCTP
jgi:hypothetical protein